MTQRARRTAGGLLPALLVLGLSGVSPGCGDDSGTNQNHDAGPRPDAGPGPDAGDHTGESICGAAPGQLFDGDHMILSDGGNITFTALNDRFTQHTWAEVGLGPNDLTGLQWTDFEVVALGTRYTWDDNCDCSRTPLTQ